MSNISLGHMNDEKEQNTQDVKELLKLHCYNLHFQHFSLRKRKHGGSTNCGRVQTGNGDSQRNGTSNVAFKPYSHYYTQIGKNMEKLITNRYANMLVIG